jgi:hypothetical protein
MAIQLLVPQVSADVGLVLVAASLCGLMLLVLEGRRTRAGAIALALVLVFSALTGTLAANPYDWDCWLAFPWCLEFPW